MTLSTTELIVIFDGPIRAIRAANALIGLAGRHNLSTRAAVHTGTCKVSNRHLAGTAIDRARTIAQAAPFDAVLVSESTYNLVSGSEFRFIEHATALTDERIYHLVR